MSKMNALLSNRCCWDSHSLPNIFARVTITGSLFITATTASRQYGFSPINVMLFSHRNRYHTSLLLTIAGAVPSPSVVTVIDASTFLTKVVPWGVTSVELVEVVVDVMIVAPVFVPGTAP